MFRCRAHLWKSWLLDIALVLAIVLYSVGLFGPLFSVKQLVVFIDTVSIASSLAQLVERGYLSLFVLTLTFSVVLPVLKLGVLARLRWRRRRGSGVPALRSLRWIERFAKWSMLDVLVVAMLVVSVKLHLVVEVQVHYGLYAFAGSVLLTMAIVPSLIDSAARSASPMPAARPRS